MLPGIFKQTLKQILIFSALGILLSSCQKQDPEHARFEIQTNWKFRESGDSIWLKATVPGCVHTDLLDNNKIDDPFYRLNEHKLQWIDKKDWEYTTTFELSKKLFEREVLELEFKGLDTYADVYLNDSLILQADNMFRSYRVNCKNILFVGNNEIRIHFYSPIKVGLQKYNSLNYIIPVSGNDLSEIGGLGEKRVGVFTRKAAYHFGWDWGPRLVTSGIWRPVIFSAWNKVKIRDLFIQDLKIEETNANLLAYIELEATEDIRVELEIKVNSNSAIKKTVSLKQGYNQLEIPFSIKKPQLWWPNGLGDQKLYNITLELNKNGHLLHSMSLKKGLRTIKIVQESDSVGRSFGFEINGIPVFAKGVNYIPQDMFLPRVDSENYKTVIRAATDANMNMIRVWGGGIYENDLFYQLCDQYGLMVWQDFMFACSMYPGDDAFLQNVKEEAIENVKRLRNHASIAIWCGNNENLSAWKNWGWETSVKETYGEKIANEIWKAYEDVFHEILPAAVKENDPDKFYWASSPSAAPGVPENDRSGDRHYWGVWWGKEAFEDFSKNIPRFMSEFGFQSFPALSSVKKYSLPEDWDITSAVMKSHQRSSIGNVTIEEYLLRDYKKPKDFEMFLYLGQLLQARGIKMGIEAQRRAMPYCMGSLYWQINDCWPVASWSSIDYYGNWKALHYAVRDAFENIDLSFEIQNDSLQIFVISDSLKNLEAELKLSVMDFHGKIITEKDQKIKLEGNKSKVYMKYGLKNLLQSENPRKILVRVILRGNDDFLIDTELYFFMPPKDLDLPQPSITVDIQEEGNKYYLTLTTDALAKNLYLQSQEEGHFSDNYFDLLPGEKKIVWFTGKGKTEYLDFKNKLKIISLVNSY